MYLVKEFVLICIHFLFTLQRTARESHKITRCRYICQKITLNFNSNNYQCAIHCEPRRQNVKKIFAAPHGITLLWVSWEICGYNFTWFTLLPWITGQPLGKMTWVVSYFKFKSYCTTKWSTGKNVPRESPVLFLGGSLHDIFLPMISRGSTRGLVESPILYTF